MSLLIDRKYVGLISLNLDKFSAVNSTTWTARCPICGDSKKNEYKTRLYIYEKSGFDGLRWMCHNCSASGPFRNLLKIVNPTLYKDYLMESFGNAKPTVSNEFIMSSKPIFEHEIKLDLPTVNEMGKDHFSFQYLSNRKILKNYFNEWYYCSDFKELVNKIRPDKADQIPDGHKCIVIPFKDENKKLLGFQARSLYNNTVRYITIKVDESFPKIFGLDKVDFSKTVYVLEGPIDSTFIPNAVAAMDSALYNASRFLLQANRVVYIFDNEPRNNEIVSKVKKTIDMGFEVVIWPNNLGWKDINEGIMQGENLSFLHHMIDENTFSGLKADLEFNRWMKI